MKCYRSKVDIWIMALIFIPLGYPIVDGIIQKEWLGVLIVGSCLAFIVYLMFAIKYCINGEVLEIKTGVLGTSKIVIAEIKSVEKKFNPLSAPAMSITRLEIKYGNKFDYALISPVKREDFLKTLLESNPDIVLKNLPIPN